MIIRPVKRLSPLEKREIQTLEHICSQVDGITYKMDLDGSLNFRNEMNHTFLCYENHRLVAFIHLFAPMQAEAELSALTLPMYRKKGYFTALFLRTAAELELFQVSDVLFVSQPDFPNNAVIDHFQANYDFSEYVMALECGQYEIRSVSNVLSLEKQTMARMEQLIAVSMSSFHDSRADARNLIEMALLSANRQGYMAVYENAIIGICYVRFEEDRAFLFGFGLHADYQNKGLGSAFFQLVLNQLFQGHTKQVMLEVESRNERALHLYKKMGFTIQETINYFRAHLKNLRGI
ncbi:GNAT family N-acetyltransferase [Sporolactobacillus sp. CPB3-1]|uniref:GNAT family N-acetyltransferase n=1 Tax=Sporolactobacillus mangiferae TaxID=2940498 RepID=A0ABT0MA39_9BACL|nr:GNAT family N-acetyltransferase [Sporolactobacillus mangiferae]MCL1631737.1 GNAT family N-acetyltransferase [Sporolactobacillus mangiferae]